VVVDGALQITTPDAIFTARSPWYSHDWIVTGISSLTLPVGVTLYVARAGGAHGYWRNAPPGLRDYFGYCDAPGLMPVIVGPRTRRAIVDHDRAGTEHDIRNETVELHIRGDEIETTTKVDRGNRTVIESQLEIHRALAADQAAVLDAWRTTAEALGGRVVTSWPPVLSVPRPFGATTIALRWSPSTHVASPAVIEASADARGAKLWSLEREVKASPNSRSLSGHPYLVQGELPLSADQLEHVVRRVEIVSIDVRRNVTATIAGHEPDPASLEALLDLLGTLCSPPSEPYR
jgi:hypothetical protein